MKTFEERVEIAMKALDRQLAAVDEATPESGYNLVGMDDYEDSGDELYVIEHYDTKDAALAALTERKKEYPDETVYVYPAEGEDDEGLE